MSRSFRRTLDITCVNETKIPVPIDKRCERECNREKRTVHIKKPISQLIYDQFPGRTLRSDSCNYSPIHICYLPDVRFWENTDPWYDCGLD